MRKRIVMLLAASLLLLARLRRPGGGHAGRTGRRGGAAVETVPPVSTEPRNMLPGLDVSGLEETMPEGDFAAVQAYLPVLTGEETFRWVAGPYDSGDPDGDWEPFDADMAAVHDRFLGNDDVEDRRRR